MSISGSICDYGQRQSRVKRFEFQARVDWLAADLAADTHYQLLTNNCVISPSKLKIHQYYYP